MDPITIVRQMMAESKFYDAQKFIELHLMRADANSKVQLLPLYLELLELQDKFVSEELLLETAELSIDRDVDEGARWVEKLPAKTLARNFRRIQLLKIKIAERKGRLEELQQLIAEFKTRLFENRVPARVPEIDELVAKYFKNDFQLKLQEVALALMLGDVPRAEIQIAELICSCVERASAKGTRERLTGVAEIIKTQKEKKQLEIYLSYCRIAVNGITEKSDYKKLAELVIYFDDFRFQLLILDLLLRLNLTEEAADYAVDVRANKQYNFVYVEKYFSHLKHFFAKAKPAAAPKPSVFLDPSELELEAPLEPLEQATPEFEENSDEEALLVAGVRFGNYGTRELVELAVGFMQSNYIRAAAEASGMALKAATGNREFLTAAYLRGTCLLKLGDHRASVDLAFEALDRAEVQDDVLSFLYLQAEAWTQLGKVREAKRTLKKILSIDAKYRLSRERLERLNEI